MKNKIIAAAILLSGIATSANSQTTAYASTTAELVKPIKITTITNMHFGRVAASGTPGTVALDYTTVRTPGGGVTLPITANGLQTAAIFKVEGEADAGFNITIPSGFITLQGSVTGSVTVSNFECNLGNASTLSVLPGEKELRVKAVLNVPANAAAGIYTNNLGNASALFVEVNYN